MGSMGPEACPNVTINPRGLRQSSEPKKVLADGIEDHRQFLATTHILPDCLDSPGTFETRNKGKRLRVVSRAVINIDVVEARRRLAQAHLTRPGLTDLDRCPVQNLGIASLPNLDRMRHQGFHKSINLSLFVTENRQFRQFIILTMMVPFQHDVVIVCRSF